MSRLFNTPTGQNFVFVPGATWGTQPTNLLEVYHYGPRISNVDTGLHYWN